MFVMLSVTYVVDLYESYMKVELGIRRLTIVDHPVAAPTIGEARKVDREGVKNSDLRPYEG